MQNEMFPNTYCMDCFANHIEYSSLNNGIFLCTNCAKKHYKLGKKVSFLVNLKEKLDPVMSMYIQRGGNNRFFKLLRKYNLEKFPPDIKYKTRICEWYRRLLRSEINCDLPPDEEVNNNYICDDNDIQEPDFINNILQFPVNFSKEELNMINENENFFLLDNNNNQGDQNNLALNQENIDNSLMPAMFTSFG